MIDEVSTTPFVDRPTNQWSVREEVLASTHRWPIIMLYFLVGSLLGYGLALAWPSPQRATTELYVGLNVDQALQERNVSEAAGIQFNYADDFKNWQMANLNLLVTMDETSRETLIRLREQDEYWLGVSREELSSMMYVYWRNAGRWRLVVQHSDPQRASQALVAWHELVLEKVRSAVLNAQDTLVLNSQLNSNAVAITQAAATSAALAQVRDSLQAWRATLSERPAGQPVDETEHWQVRAPVESAVLGPEWQSLLDPFPSLGAAAQDYIAWIDRGTVALEEKLKVLQAEIMTLEQEQGSLEQQYRRAAEKSRGFSANLVVEPVSGAGPSLSVLRPTGLMALLGGVFGLLVWVLVWLARITLKARR